MGVALGVPRWVVEVSLVIGPCVLEVSFVLGFIVAAGLCENPIYIL
jgi:hypothetical protein